MVNITKTLAACAIAAVVALTGCQLNPSADCPPGSDCYKDLIVTPGSIIPECGGPCGAGLECLSPTLNPCIDTCVEMVGETCVTPDPTCTCQAPPVCGDGVQEGAEECDDGNTANGDGCNDVCELEACGNGVLDVGEDCDDGDTLDDAVCDSDCTFVVCGDSHVNSVAGEACDDGNAVGGDGCSPTCQLESCGNGSLDVGEVCDDGNTVGGDGCSADCLSDETCGNNIHDPLAGEDCDDGGVDSAACDSDCSSVVCGDGHTNAVAGESCDDSGESATCDADCSPVVCGDGVTNATAGEVCDDGNTTDGDGCAANCLSDETCPNGILDVAAGEECDDGNAIAGDGCSPTCMIEVEDCSTPGDDDLDGDINCADSDCSNDPICTCASIEVAFPNNGRIDMLTGSGQYQGWDVPAGTWYTLDVSQYDAGLTIWMNGTLMSAENILGSLAFYLVPVAYPTTPSGATQAILPGGSVNRSGDLNLSVGACTAP